MSDHLPQPLFLGVCSKTLTKADGVFQDFLQVAEVACFPFFPTSLQGMYLLMAFPAALLRPEIKTRVVLRVKDKPTERAWIDVMTGRADPTPEIVDLREVKQGSAPISDDGIKTLHGLAQLHIRDDTRFKLLPLPIPSFALHAPATIEVCTSTDADAIVLGTFEAVFALPAPLSDEERAALRSRPGASQTVVMTLQCKACGDNYRVSSSLREENALGQKDDTVPISTAPEQWTCKCGAAQMSLQYLKKGLHDLLRHGRVTGEEVTSFIPLYEHGAISAIIQGYERLVQSSPSEEAVQDYLKRNPILWHFLSPKRIWYKPPVLTHFKADFAILSRTNSLFLIELEKPQTRLFKSNGGLAAEVQLGFSQIREWKAKIQDHRLAILDCLDLSGTSVDIKYVLIAGLSRKSQEKHLMALRSNPAPADQFLCFDDLAAILNATQTAIAGL